MKDQAAKADANKTDPTLLQRDFAPALYLIQRVLDYGREKYDRGSWKKVELDRWDAAQRRHQQEIDFKQPADEESGLPHRAHQIAGLIIMFQLELNKGAQAAHCSPEQIAKLLGQFNPPPQDHKGQPTPLEYTEAELRRGIDDLMEVVAVPVASAQPGHRIRANVIGRMHAPFGLEHGNAYEVVSKRLSYVTVKVGNVARQYSTSYFY